MLNKKCLVIIVLFFIVDSAFSQTIDLKRYFYFPQGHKSWALYDYKYSEFNNSSFIPPDSSDIFESFIGELTVTIDDTEYISDTTKYKLLISKKGIKTLKTIYETLSVDTLDYSYNTNVFEINNINEGDGHNHFYGWIFSDSLVESINDTFDITPVYPYSKFYRFYNLENNDSLYHRGDTLIIHYRPKTTNYYDSYFSADYIVSSFGAISYNRYYSYYQQGFREEYRLTNYMIVGVKDENKNIPSKFTLSQNYPNPFNPSTTIKYSIPSVETRRPATAGSPHVILKIYNMLGQEVAILVNKEQNSGNYEVIFDASCINRKISSGIYFYELKFGSFVETKKMILLK